MKVILLELFKGLGINPTTAKDLEAITFMFIILFMASAFWLLSKLLVEIVNLMVCQMVTSSGN